MSESSTPIADAFEMAAQLEDLNIKAALEITRLQALTKGLKEVVTAKESHIQSLLKITAPNIRIVIAIVDPGYELKYPWKNGEALLLLGEIGNIPGHVAVATTQGKVHWAYDLDSFREPTDDEL